MLEQILRRLEVIETTQTQILRILTAREDEKRPGLTQVAFAKAIGRSVWTVHRWVKQGKLRLEKGRIPHSELRKFLS